MKTKKVILVAFLMAFATIGFTQVDQNVKKEPPPTQFSVLISLEAAVQNPGLKLAIYDQVSPRIFRKPFRVFIAKVEYRGTIFNIRGTFKAWQVFFSVRPVAEREER